MRRPALRRAAPWLLALYAAFLAFVLLGPSASMPNESVSVLSRLVNVVVPESIATPSRVEFGANVLIIVPVSLLGSVISPRLNWRDWTTAGFVLSGGVELFQALFLAERSATFNDVAANTLGAALGALLYRLLTVRHEGSDSASSPRSAGKRPKTL